MEKPNWVKIDGSHGEGGGQLLRYGIALSALTNRPSSFKKIRANRRVSGLRPQHVSAVSCIQEICNAVVEGLEVGSEELTFIPRKIEGMDITIDTHTAASMTLIFQACILASLKSSKSFKIRVIGGTDVRWAPSWDYFSNVFISVLKRFGLDITTSLVRRGHYPRGGGIGEIMINPINSIKPVVFDDKNRYTEIEGTIHCCGLPDNIATRMHEKIVRDCSNKGVETRIEIEQTESDSPGCGVTLWSSSDDHTCILGSCGLGSKGTPAERIARDTVRTLLDDIAAGVSLDVFAFDQIIPYLILAGNDSCASVRDISRHAQSALWLIKRFIPKEYSFIQSDGRDFFHVK